MTVATVGDVLAHKATRAPKKFTKRDYARIRKEAVAAGHAAMEKSQPQMMMVHQHKHVLDDNSPVVKSYGPYPVCGFASVVLRPATSGFARWLKAQGRHEDFSVFKHYYGGLELFIGVGGQSMDVKYDYAKAVAEVFNSYGFTAHATSRMD